METVSLAFSKPSWWSGALDSADCLRKGRASVTQRRKHLLLPRMEAQVEGTSDCSTGSRGQQVAQNQSPPGRVMDQHTSHLSLCIDLALFSLCWAGNGITVQEQRESGCR